jgi:flavin-dependent dehydrogenase
MAGEAEFDVIVVGARCAGAPLATDFARRGLRVCLADRARFPSEVPSTHMVHPSGVARLGRLGLMDQLRATGAPSLDHGTFVIDDARLAMEPEVAARFEAPWLCIRRVVLDQLLVDAAEHAGAVMRDGTAVVGLIEENGAVSGVRTADGVLRARLVVGADGPHSVVARMVGAREYHVTSPGRLFLWGYFEGAAAPSGYATLGRVGDIGFLAMPTDGGLYMAGVAASMTERDTYMADTRVSLARALNGLGEVAEFVRPATPVGPVRTMVRWHGYFREATGPGWVLVGDAGHFKDPTPAQGISDALRQGEKLAQTIEDGLGKGDLERRLREWWRWRDDDAWEMYWFANDMGTAGEIPGIVTEMMSGLGREPDGPERFLRVLNHDLAPSQVFTPRRAVRSVIRGSIKRPRALAQLVGETGALVADEMRRRRVRRRPRWGAVGDPTIATAAGREGI